MGRGKDIWKAIDYFKLSLNLQKRIGVEANNAIICGCCFLSASLTLEPNKCIETMIISGLQFLGCKGMIEPH